MEVLSDSKCGVRFGERTFDREIIEVLKGIQGSRFEPSNKEWLVNRDLMPKFYKEVA